MSETVEEVPVEKPKRKTWKIVVPVIVAIIVVILVVSLVGMYVYAYNALGDTVSKSFDTIYISDPGTMMDTECIAEFTMHNPTGTSIRLVEVSFDIWVDGEMFGTIQHTDKLLPAGGSIILTSTLHYGSEVMDIILYPPYLMKLIGKVVASTNILFLTVTRTYQMTETETITW